MKKEKFNKDDVIIQEGTSGHTFYLISKGKVRIMKETGVRMSKSIEEKQKEKLYEIKIVLLGDPAVGKSSLVQRFCQDKFEENYKLTIGGAYLQKDVKLKNGDTLKLHI